MEHAALRLHLAALRIGSLHVDADNEVVHRPDDGLLHGPQRVVQFLHHGVAVAAIADELVAAQFDGVVLVYLVLDVHVTDARVGRNQVDLFLRVGEVLLDVAGQPQLGLQLLGIGTVLLRLAHIHACRGGNVHHAVLALERFEVGLHITQLLTDDDEALVDEVGRVDRHLVLVSDGLFVIDGDEHVEHIFGQDGRTVFQRQGEDGGFVLLLPYAQASLVAGHHGIQRQLLHRQLTAYPRLAVEVGGGNHHPSAPQGEGVVHLHGEALLVFFAGQVGEQHRAVVLGHQPESDVTALRGIGKADLHGRLRIEFVAAQPVLHTVTDVGMQPLHHLSHQSLGAELENLVGHVHLVDEVVVTVQPCCGGLVRGVLDDDRGRAEIDQRRAGILHIGQPPEQQHGAEKPRPLGGKVEQEVYEIQPLLAIAG